MNADDSRLKEALGWVQAQDLVGATAELERCLERAATTTDAEPVQTNGGRWCCDVRMRVVVGDGVY